MAEKFAQLRKKLGPMLGYNSASIFFGGSTYIISLYFLSFLTEVEKLSPTQAGMVIAVAHIWDAVTDPAMGIITDRTRSKYGRHRRYILWGVIPVAVTYFMMWNSFGISSHNNSTATMAYYMVAYMLFNTAYTLVCVPHTAMLPVIAEEYFERTQYKSIEYIMNSVGMVSSFLLVSISLGFTTLEMNEGSRTKFMILGGVLCLWFSLPLLLTFKYTKEPSSLGMRLPPLDVSYTINEYKMVFKNRAFRRYFSMSLAYTIAKGFTNNSRNYFFKYAADRFRYLNTLQSIAGVAEASGFPLNYYLTAKKGKQFCGKLLTPVMILGLLVCLPITFFAPISNTVIFGINVDITLVILIVSTVLFNFGFSGPGFVVSNIQPDVTDVDELITGQRREGVISTFSSFIKKTINGVMSGATGLILGAFGFQTGVEDMSTFKQTTTAIFGLNLTYIIIPVIFSIITFVLIFRYKMTKDDHEMIRRVIAEKKENGEVEMTAEEIKRCEEISGQKMIDMWIGQKTKLDEETMEVTS